MPNICVAVLGPAKSGTSLTAGLLRTMGVDFGTHLKMQGPAPHRYYEDFDVINMLLKDNPNKTTPEAIVKRLAKPLWGIKLPRLTFDWHLFAPYVDEVRFVVTRRNILAHRRSYQQQVARVTDKKFFSMLDRQYSTLAQFANPRIEISFDNWFTDSAESQLWSLSKYVGGHLTEETRQLIDHRMRHYR